MSKKYSVHTDSKTKLRVKRHLRIRKKVFGTAERPRLCVTRSNRRLCVQLIDDSKGATLLAGQTPAGKSANVTSSTALGKDIATKAKSQGITKCVFDRGGYIYHGKIAALASGAREAGLAF